MDIDIYISNNNHRKFLFVKKGANPADILMNSDGGFDQDFSKIKKLKSLSNLLRSDKERYGLRQADIGLLLDQIDASGIGILDYSS